MALKGRQPSSAMLHHSDRGSQYASQEYQQLLAAHGILSSMSRVGNCWDNAVAESFFATLKLELVYQTRWATRAEARSAVFEYIELFYNRQRAIPPSATCALMSSSNVMMYPVAA